MNIEWSSFSKLTEDNILSEVPTSAGIYLLWIQLINEEWDCYYVGQSKNLEQRLLSHMSDDEPNECMKNNVHNHISGCEYAEVGRQDDRDGIEKYLYEQYSPECNERDPGGTPIQVNLP